MNDTLEEFIERLKTAPQPRTIKDVEGYLYLTTVRRMPRGWEGTYFLALSPTGNIVIVSWEAVSALQLNELHTLDLPKASAAVKVGMQDMIDRLVQAKIAGANAAELAQQTVRILPGVDLMTIKSIADQLHSMLKALEFLNKTSNLQAFLKGSARPHLCEEALVVLINLAETRHYSELARRELGQK